MGRKARGRRRRSGAEQGAPEAVACGEDAVLSPAIVMAVMGWHHHRA
jgi:hypothetical protein